MIPFDYPRLIPAMGGNAVVVPRLDSFFSKLICWGEPCFNMANEPDFVVPYAYEYTDAALEDRRRHHPHRAANLHHQTGRRPRQRRPRRDLRRLRLERARPLSRCPRCRRILPRHAHVPRSLRPHRQYFRRRTLIITSEGSGPYVTAISLNGQPYNSLWLPLDKIPPTPPRPCTSLCNPPNQHRRSCSHRPPSGPNAASGVRSKAGSCVPPSTTVRSG